jgi:hypothetical protein
VRTIYSVFGYGYSRYSGIPISALTVFLPFFFVKSENQKNETNNFLADIIVSQIIVNCKFLQMAERKAVIKNADMSEDMQQDAVDCASQALEKYNIEKVS